MVLLLILLLLCSTYGWATPQLQVPPVSFTRIPLKGTVKLDSAEQGRAIQVWVGGKRAEQQFRGDTLVWQAMLDESGETEVVLQFSNDVIAIQKTKTLPGWTTTLPALIAIGLAFITRQVILSLFAGIWFGAWLLYAFSIEGIYLSIFDVVSRFTLHAIAPPSGNSDHAAVLLFTLLIGGFVGIITKNGGAYGLVKRFQRFARSATSGQLTTSFLGILFFFDDYANALVIGNVMRPIADRLRISREKLAYLVDSTSAPVASLMIMTTWIGFEIGLIQDAVAKIPGINQSGYEIFIASLAYRFYPILALVLLFIVILLRRDIGPMWKAEVKARQQAESVVYATPENEGTLEPHSSAEVHKHYAASALIPLAILLGVLFWGLLTTGSGNTLSQILGSANSYQAMLWASIAGCIAAIAMGVLLRNFSIAQSMKAWMEGVQQMMVAAVILLLAWGLAEVNHTLGTATYLTSLLSDTIAPIWLPTTVFVLAAFASFATGSSWGVMAILMPLVIPLTWSVLETYHLTGTSSALSIFYATVGSVLAGSVWGDHCSPISDTTILSSLASGCDHIEHVRTQLPYALLAGVVAIFLGLLPTAMGIPWWGALGIAILVLLGFVRLLGKSVPEYRIDR